MAFAKRAIAPLTNGRVTLRLLEEADLPMTLAWRNQDHIRKWFFSPQVISWDEHRAWYEQYKDRDDDFVFVVEETDTLKRPVGQAALYHIDRARGRGEFGRLMIGDLEARGLGLARQATDRIVREALGPWALSELYLECIEGNRPALQIYEACGFQRVSVHQGVVRMRADRASVTARAE